ncbi:DUF1405 domain-containing protein [Bacillus sp. AGMB 02131]|uniref:DUF1405 domain-containing protein n=1 Tax=Peribacillus faecalis TaxID=2772559 RepID=A0A927HDB5_9BACI|nr:DUF1405 domain-containing protein [Peribacillus faecalis]MBD3110406.1 DUF1405 domain-containing protein [Peribacillus faecalis]
MNEIYAILRNKKFIVFLLIINIFGTIYGYDWYGHQLAETELIFIPFVPDSPTACLFFVIVLIGFLMNKNWGVFEALAFISLFKYGVWAVVMNVWTLMVSDNFHWTGYMLMASHAAMAIQALLYSPFYRIKVWHLSVAAVFTLHNEIIDYVFGQMPWYGSLSVYINEIAYFTFWLSVLSIFVCYYFGMKKQCWTLTL